MAIKYKPTIGSVLICDFDGMRFPEITKRRPVIVISAVSTGLCIVVPCSTTAPVPIRPFRYKIEDFDFLPAPYDSIVQWVKCDMIYTVSYDRLTMAHDGKDENGKRKYIQKVIEKRHLDAIRKAVSAGLCINLLQDVDTDSD